MLVSVLNLIYRGFLKRALLGIATQGGRLWPRSWRHSSSSSALVCSWRTLLTPIVCA